MAKPKFKAAEKVKYFGEQLAAIRAAIEVLKQFEKLTQTWLEKSKALAEKQG
ncbi:MAG: hypothetical protein M5U29_02525 [Anaerolineae bacterium]|nr:hypothetical protein [Anaerolineae bacterium]